jgi:hypothetical protein
MKDPRRLRDENHGPLAAALLQTGMSYRSSARARTGTLAALGLLSSTALSTTMASATFFAKVGWAKLTAGVIATAVAAVPVAYYGWNNAKDEPAPASPAATPAPQTKADQMVKPAPAPTLDVEEPSPEPDTSKDGSNRRATGKHSTGSALLTAELKALDAARSALAGGNAVRALRLLDDYARRYPRGRLGLEAEVLRIDALARSGQGAAAQTRARAFLKRRPNSVLAARVRAHLGE